MGGQATPPRSLGSLRSACLRGREAPRRLCRTPGDTAACSAGVTTCANHLAGAPVEPTEAIRFWANPLSLRILRENVVICLHDRMAFEAALGVMTLRRRAFLVHGGKSIRRLVIRERRI